MVVETDFNSYKIGELPEGCKKCVIGSKLVLYVTGLCPRNCFYCPLSEKRQGDKVFANERPIKEFEEIVTEANKMNALGAGLTGGDPLNKINRTVKYIKDLKNEFGEDFHIHLYTTGKYANMENLERIYSAGLDEIRFHPDIYNEDTDNSFNSIKRTMKFDWDVGGEIPIIPEKKKPIKEYASFLDDIGAKFLNLNELELAEVNSEELISRNLRLIDDEGSAVEGSLSTGLEFLEWAENNTSIDYHLCPSKLKDETQMQNRLIRTAEKIKKPYEEISDEGLLRKTVVESKNHTKQEIIKQIRSLDVPEEMFGRNSDDEVELAWWIADDLKEFDDLDLQFYFVEEYPTWDRLETFRSPLENL